MSHQQRAIAIVLTFGALVGACRSNAGRAAATGGDARFVVGGSGSAQIVYQPRARVVERARGLELLRGVSSDGWTLALDARAQELSGLRAGDVLVLKYLLARKVVAADTEGGTVYVLTDAAALGEVINKGTIQFDAPVRFGTRVAEGRAANVWNTLAEFAVPTAYAQEPEKKGYDPDPFTKAKREGTKEAAKKMVEGLYKDWKTTFSAVPNAGRVDLSLTMTKDLAGLRALITGTGYLTDFDLSAKVDVDEGVVQRMEAMSKRINGVMNFTWEVATETPGAHTGDDRIKFPAPIKIPLAEFVGGLPLFIEIGGAIIIKPAMSGGHEYSHGAFRVTYDGYQHFSAKEGTIDSDGNVKGDIKFLEGQNISALAPHGFVLAVAAPRVELKLGMSDMIDEKLWKKFEGAAENVDKYAETLLKRVLSPEQYEAFEGSPISGVTIAKAMKDVVASDADAFIELVTSSGASFSGMSAIFPCTRTDIHLMVKVGASAKAMGQEVGKTEKEIFKRDFSRVDPPDAGLCTFGG
jgi:hypothetical protein